VSIPKVPTASLSPLLIVSLSARREGRFQLNHCQLSLPRFTIILLST